jgi:oligo-alginate lyase
MASLQMVNPFEALIDLASVLGVLQAQRRARFLKTSLEIEDSILGARPGIAIRWAMCTEADIKIDGNTATLTQKGKTLHLGFSGQGVVLSVLDISQPRSDFDQPNPNLRQLIATAPVASDGCWRVRVGIFS